MDARKVVLTTGVSSGIGRAAARLLARNGHFAALAARRRDRLETLARELRDTDAAASAILYCLERPQRVAVTEITVRPTTQEL